MFITNLFELNLATLNFNDKRILSILLLFIFFHVFSQQVTIENQNNFVLKVNYKNYTIELNEREKKTILAADINRLNIEYTIGKDQLIPLFLNSNESLKITINNYDKPIEFKGDKDVLHNLIVNQQHYILYKNIVKCQDIYYKKKNTKELINFSEFVLADYLNKIKTFNSSPHGTEDKTYKRIEKYVINDWVASLFLFLTGAKKLDLQSKELILYYYNKYIQKEVENYNCEYKFQYNIINELARYADQININLPKYSIIERTEDDATNQYLPKSCQQYYFENNYNYFNHINNPKKEYYKNILKEKFNN